MAADVVNLRLARKRKARAEADARAAENRARFGRTKAQRAHDDAEKDAAQRALDGHRIERDDEI